MARVSAVIRTYNRAQYLGAAIDSVLSQTFPDLEVIVVDDGSTDSTPAMLAGYGARVQIVRFESSRGPAAAFNAGVQAACGELIAFLDADDLWLPDKIHRQLGLLDRSDRFGFAYGNARLLFPDGSLSRPVLRPDQIVSGSILRTIVQDMCVHTSTVIVRRAALNRIGPCDERFRLCEDYDWFLRLARETEGICAAEPVVLIRQHGEQISALGGLDTYRAAIIVLAEFLADPVLPLVVQRDGQRTLARHHLHLARSLIRAGDRGQACRHCLQALRRAPWYRPAWRWLFRTLARPAG